MTASAGTALADHGVVRVRGDAAVGFLQRLLTARFEGLEPGEARPTLLLDNKGRVQAALLASARDDGLVLVGESAPLTAARETLTRYVLGADVVLEDSDEAVLFLATDPGVDTGGAAAHGPDGGIWITTADVDATVAKLAAAGVEPLAASAFERWRVAHGWPRHGAEISGREFPQELRLETAVDFDKGCYLGQETVARIHYRGQVNRLLCLLQCAAPPAPEDGLLAAGKEAGRITSVAASEEPLLALALLAREHAEAGTELVTAAGVAVRVVDWPGAGA